MTKNSTSSHFIENTKKETNDENKLQTLNSEFADIQNAIENQQIQAPQKSVDFILNFNKAYKTEKLENGEYAEMIIN